ncbi:hypothetical protein Pla110_44470 [Polystyrenella longa]|uniref:Uncharacterized protein n=1 Tax=Polystyrenella longa TaxID=2528007 RepID=A0A518CTX6_9PLAN|nr:hypothetical protein [Polystyrenella longa]QDU82686.1 hypothetical protein Pla110_44470 [Polystyrenella longa]
MKTLAELEQMIMMQANEIRLLKRRLERMGRHPITGGLRLCKTTEAGSKGDPVTVEWYEGDLGTETTTEKEGTPWLRLADIDDDVWAYAGRVNGRLEIINAECGGEEEEA